MEKGGGVPGFSSTVSISSMSLQHRAKVGFYGEDVRQLHTKSEHDARALRGFFSKTQIVYEFKFYLHKYLHKNTQGHIYALQRRNTENWKQIFPDKELRSLSVNFHIHVSVSDLYIMEILTFKT